MADDPLDGDNVPLGTTERTPRSPQEPQPTPKPPTPHGELLTLAPDEAAKRLHKMWKSQTPRYAKRSAEWTVNERRQDGETGVWVIKSQDLGMFKVYTPPGANRAPIPVSNLPARLCRRMTSQLFADPFLPEVEPSTESDEDKDAADLTQRVLEDVDSEGNLNDPELQKAAFQLGHVAGSGYILYYPDPYAGGRQPISLEASPNAQHVDEATRDPSTGQPWDHELTTRHVRPDQTLTDNPGEADLQWHARLDACVYHARHVRFLPWKTRGMDDADGVMVAELRPWSEVKRNHDALRQLREDDVREICSYRPPGWDDLTPHVGGKAFDPKGADIPVDDLLCAYIRVWYTESAEYEDGAYLAVVGEKTVVEQGPWVGQDETGRFKLDLPLAQSRVWRDPNDPHGRGTMDDIGNGGEARAAVYGMYFDYCDRIANQKVFVPTNSLYSGKEALMEYQKYVQMNPGGEPKYEEIPPMPREIGETLDRITQEINDASELQETAQGLDSGTAESGRAKLAVVAQVHANMSDTLQNVRACHERSWRIKRQLIRWKYTKPQMISYVGADGAFEVERWRGSDLSGTKDVKLKPGSGTMMTTSQKINEAFGYLQWGLVDKADVEEIAGTGISATMGKRDNPHRQRVRRQIAKWEQGPDPMAPPMPMGGPMMGGAPGMPPPPTTSDHITQGRAALMSGNQPATAQHLAAAKIAHMKDHAEMEQLKHTLKSVSPTGGALGGPSPMPDPQMMGGPPPPMMGPPGAPPMGAPPLPPGVVGQIQPMMPPPPQPDPVAAAIFSVFPVDNQPDVAMTRQRELGHAMAGTKYESFPVPWRLALDMAYAQAAQAAAPPMPVAAAPPSQGGTPAPTGEAPPPALMPSEQAMAGGGL